MNLIQSQSLEEIERDIRWRVEAEVRAQIRRELVDYAMNFSIVGPGGMDYVGVRSVERIIMGDYS